MSLKGFSKKFRAYKVPSIILKNGVKTWIVGGRLQRNPNTLVDPWDLMGYEPRSDPTEIIGPGFGGKLRSGVGYVCDEQGVTVSFKRNGPAVTEETSAQNQEIVFGFWEAYEYHMTAEKIPFVLISNNGCTATWGGEIRKRGSILTDGPGKPVYHIMPDTPMIEIANLRTGQISMGYLCDESGVTVDLKRDFRVTYPEDIDDPVKLAEIKARNEKIIKGEVVGITINFCGAIGSLGTFDIIPRIFDVGQSKRNLYIGLIGGIVLGLILGVVL